MKAWALAQQAPAEERPLELVEWPAPRPQDHEIRLRTLACGICRTDIHIAEGDLPLRRAPVIPGHEIVGIVDAVGGAVAGFPPGDRAGVFWVHSTCGRCKYCISERENYCQCRNRTLESSQTSHFAPPWTRPAAWAAVPWDPSLRPCPGT